MRYQDVSSQMNYNSELFVSYTFNNSVFSNNKWKWSPLTNWQIPWYVAMMLLWKAPTIDQHCVLSALWFILKSCFPISNKTINSTTHLDMVWEWTGWQMLCTVKPCLSGHVRSRENFRINEVSVYMKHDLFAHVLYVEWWTCAY